MLGDMDPRRIVVAGDWHGNSHCGRGAITYAALRDIHVIVQLGDFGYWTPGTATIRLPR